MPNLATATVFVNIRLVLTPQDYRGDLAAYNLPNLKLDESQPAAGRESYPGNHFG